MAEREGLEPAGEKKDRIIEHWPQAGNDARLQEASRQAEELVLSRTK